jgi:lysozyme
MQRNGLNWVAGTTTAGIIAGVMAFVEPFEGTVLRTHPDPIGVTSACRGNRSAAVPGATFTIEECDLLLLSDAIVAVIATDKIVKVEMSDEEWIAVASLVFNAGWSAVAKSTLVRKLNEGDRAGAAAEFDRWVRAGGQVLPGLVVRRAKEARLFLARPT